MTALGSLENTLPRSQSQSEARVNLLKAISAMRIIHLYVVPSYAKERKPRTGEVADALRDLEQTMTVLGLGQGMVGLEDLAEEVRRL
jgi:hypothetical protein